MSTDLRAFVVKAVDDGGCPIPGIFEDIQRGKARIGWSYDDQLDLRRLDQKLEQGLELDDDEETAKRCLGFLRHPGNGDYLLYPHQPARGLVTIARVVGEYDFSAPGDSIEGDFRSFRPCEMIGSEPIALDDEVMQPALRYRLGRPGRFSEIYEIELVHSLVEALGRTGKREGSGSEARRARIRAELKQNLSSLIRREFSRHDFSRRFCRELFERMKYSTEVQEGRNEKGSDLLVWVTSPLLLNEVVVGVQAFAYEGDVSPEDLQAKLKQLLDGWKANKLDQGLLLTTGHCGPAGVKLISIHNKREPSQPVKLIDGDELAELYMTFFVPDPRI